MTDAFWKEWALDVTLGYSMDGIFAWVPMEDDCTTVVWGMTVLSDSPPHNGKPVAVVSEIGQDHVEEVLKKHGNDIEAMFNEIRSKQ